ncbi:hypothetical protein LTR12_013029 [Friedmanniomyces endolithicus]|nr:hypothetical protein LTR74_003322 [Friedmanniomyces endolithicus]KAK1812608.1 hypothetical protein LTR12_013029 [Friedmanniomyces endolithicus]
MSAEVDNPCRQPFQLLLGAETMVATKSCRLFFDDPEQYITTEASEHEIYLLLGSAKIDGECIAGSDILEKAPSWSGYHYECLAVEPVERQPGHFRRVGKVVLAILETDDEGRRTTATMEEDKRLRRVVDTQFRTHDISEDLYESVDENFLYTITLRVWHNGSPARSERNLQRFLRQVRERSEPRQGYMAGEPRRAFSESLDAVGILAG